MKYKVKLTHAVTMVVEGKSEDQIQDWLLQTTPEEAYFLAYDNGNPQSEYEEEIICEARGDSAVDYVIKEEE